jgi:hypothetical protein
MAQVVEDLQSLLPGLHGGLELAVGLPGVTEVAQSNGFVEAVGKFAVQAECPLVAGGGLSEVAEVVLGVAQAVPGSCLALAVPDLRAEGE